VHSPALFRYRDARTRTSVEQIDKTYGHLLLGSEEYMRGLLDAFERAGVKPSR
jgi:hypothetical protein